MKKRLYTFFILMLTTACTFQSPDIPITIPVDDVEVPSGNTLGAICYVEVKEQSVVKAKYATYKVKATYQSVGSSPVTANVYGRKTEPQNVISDDLPCMLSASQDDLVLSDDIILNPNESQEIEIGGDNAFGRALADLLLTEPSYWLGASLEGGSLGESGKIALKDGKITVTF